MVYIFAPDDSDSDVQVKAHENADMKISAWCPSGYSAREGAHQELAESR